MMNHSYADCEIESSSLMRKCEVIGYDGSMGLVLRCNFDQVCRTVAPDNEDVAVDGEILAIPAADIKSDRTWGERLEEGFHDWPWFVARRREMRCDLFVYLMHVFFLVFFWGGILGGSHVVQERNYCRQSSLIYVSRLSSKEALLCLPQTLGDCPRHQRISLWRGKIRYVAYMACVACVGGVPFSL